MLTHSAPHSPWLKSNFLLLMIKIIVTIIIIKKQWKHKIIKKWSPWFLITLRVIPKETASYAFKLFHILSFYMSQNIHCCLSYVDGSPWLETIQCFLLFVGVFQNWALDCLLSIFFRYFPAFFYVLPVPVCVTERHVLHNHNFKVSQRSWLNALKFKLKRLGRFKSCPRSFLEYPSKCRVVIGVIINVLTQVWRMCYR